LLGPQLSRRDIDEVYELHRDTFLRHGHEPYLTRAFFRALPGAIGEHFMVKRARLGDETVAAAVFYWSRDALYGRYWGTKEQFHSLHFEPAITRESSSASSAESRASNPAPRVNTR
jgi:predicted N-acyltransferase